MIFLLCCIGAGVDVSSTASAAIDVVAEANSNSTIDLSDHSSDKSISDE